MGAVGSTGAGSGVGYYTKGMHQSYTDYMTGSGAKAEPPGRWSGKGAEKLGLTGQIEPAAMERLYEKGLDPRDASGRTRFGNPPRDYKGADEILAAKLAKEPYATPERQEELRIESHRETRSGRSFHDWTFSPSKDISVRHAAVEFAERRAEMLGRPDEASRYRSVRETIERACEAGNQAGLAYLTERAGYVRTGRHDSSRTGTWVKADELVIATFPQHDSRAHDPQLHWHNPILLNTEYAPGKVGKLDTRLIEDHKHAAASIGARVMQETLSRELGWEQELRTDGNCFETKGVSQEAKDLFSDRRATITKGMRPLVSKFTDEHGRQPTNLELSRMKQFVTLSTRERKSGEPETREQQLARFDAEIRAAIGHGLAREAVAAGRVGQPPEVKDFSPTAVTDMAVAKAHDNQASFTKANLIPHIETSLPPYIGVTDPKQVQVVLEGLAEAAINRLATRVSNAPTTKTQASALTHADGTSMFVRPGSTRYASKDHIAAEYAMQRAAVERGRMALPASLVRQWVDKNADWLRPDQKDAIVGIASSGAAVSLMVGPAGTGKTTTAGILNQCWQELAGGRVIGLATSEHATDVLRDEGIESKNFTQWLNAQERLDAAGGVQSLSHSATRTVNASDRDKAWAVKPGDILAPDEASMADTDKLAKIQFYADRAGARVLKMGDHKQLSAVGAGGLMDLVANTDGADKYELREVMRFKDEDGSIRQWEATASLDLRAGKLSAITEYDKHGCWRDGGSAEQAMRTATRMYVGDRLGGRSPVVVVPTNRMAAAVNAMVRDELVKSGRISQDGVYLARDQNVAGVGDIIKCRVNDHQVGVKNQGRYLVVKADDGAGNMVVRAMDSMKEFTLSPEYRDQAVELGYAGTVHSIQGSTEDTGIAIISGSQPLESLYPAMTRGRDRNTGIVVTQPEDPMQDTGQTHERVVLDAKAVIAEIIERDNDEAKAALRLQRDDAVAARSMDRVLGMYERGMHELTQERTRDWLDHLTAEGKISDTVRAQMGHDEATTQLGRLLRVAEQAGHDPEQVLRDAVGSRPLDDARSASQVLYTRIADGHKGELTPQIETALQPPAGTSEADKEHFDELAEVMRERQAELGTKVADEQPAWAVDSLGPVPETPVERLEWEHRAGVVAAHREATGWTDEAEALAPAPGVLHPEQRAAWHGAWDAAGRPSATKEEHELSDGALRVRVEAMARENATLPPPVHSELRATESQRWEHMQTAAILRSEAENQADDKDYERMIAEAKAAEDMVERLAAKAAELDRVAEDRARLHAETAVTRDLGQRALDELGRRGVPHGQEPDRVTLEEWMVEHDKAMKAEDPHREITEVDAPSEVYDEKVDDLVQLPDKVEDTVVEQQAALPSADVKQQDDIVDAELVDDAEDETSMGVQNLEVLDHEDEAVVDAEPAMPKDVPTAVEVEVAVTATKVAVDEATNRASAEAAQRAHEAEQDADYAARVDAWQADESAAQQVADEQTQVGVAM